MSQATRRWISDKVQSLREADVLPFHDILDARMVHAALAEEGVTFSERIYTPLVTLGLFLSQVLDPDHSCRAAVARLIVWLSINGRKPCAPDTGSYCDARRRLPLGVVTRLVRQTAREIDGRAPDDWLWKGRRVVLVDGTTASMPDTPENQRAFPQPKSQGVGLGFPPVRMVAIISLATGVVQDLASGPYQGKETGETALFRTPWDRLGPGTSCWGIGISPRSSGSRGWRNAASRASSACTIGVSSTSAGAAGSAWKTTSLSGPSRRVPTGWTRGPMRDFPGN